MKVHAVENGLHNFAAYVFEIDVDATGSGSDELSLPAGMLVIDGRIEAKIIFDPLTFFIGTRDADDTAAMNFADLSGDAASGAGGGGNDESLAGLRPADIEDPKISG